MRKPRPAVRALVAGGLAASAAVVALASPASATHTHVRHVGNGLCVVLAGNGAEHEVELPAPVADPSTYPAGRRHPLHVLVHMGEPGEHGTIEVLGKDTCTGFVNG
ncbi:MAG: hypothetical protein KatS3mg010_1621 [Acidimicrobiia bacterium]|nr:MAG: hypothetical protein KatS3mg010_1621 [Acidimicrobiia bacterium]